MKTHFATTHKTLHLGSLGTITAAAYTPEGSPTEICTYIGGLPYAEALTQDHRFRLPRPLADRHSYGTHEKPGQYTRGTALCPQPSFMDDAPDQSLWSEDCLQLNIWIPSGPVPPGGWPVFFFIHGGWLQFGTANMDPSVIATLFHQTPFRAVVVMPSYRLNLFGFLASQEIYAEAEAADEQSGNMGFWDQRMALEWVKQRAHSFGGDSSKITVGGYSAGSHSTFQQLAHDLDLPESQRCIRRVIMWANGPGVKPKNMAEHQKQFDELLGHLDISLDLPPAEKLHLLRGISATKLVEVQSRMSVSEFRALSDNDFISPTTIAEIDDGRFAAKCAAAGIKILNGECSAEHHMYGAWRTPANTFTDFRRRLLADYPSSVVERYLDAYMPDHKLPAKYSDWSDAFGHVYADIQVYGLERGFADRLCRHGLVAGRDVLRYRMEWRAKCVDADLPPEWGVTHSSDYAIWWWGCGQGEGLTKEEEEIVKPWNKLFSDFVGFQEVEWPETGDQGRHLILRANGRTEMGDDTLWEEGVRLWNVVNVA